MSLKRANIFEKEWMHMVKELRCGCCGLLGPSDAHHILGEDHRRISHFMTIPLCHAGCHQDAFLGIHGQKKAWVIHKKTELKVLAETIEKIVRALI